MVFLLLSALSLLCLYVCSTLHRVIKDTYQKQRRNSRTKMRATVIHASRYDFKDDQSRSVSGCKVTFLSETVEATNPNAKGREVVTVSAPYGIYDRFSQVPGEYELNLSYKMSLGKALIRLLDAAPVAVK